MDRNFARSLALVLKSEGGFVNLKADPGGPTNRGITLANFRAYIKPNGTIEDLKNLTVEQAGVCYRRQYWDAICGAELPDGVDYATFDFCVNSGPSRAAKYLQAVVGVVQDGRIGPATVKAALRAVCLSLC
jgi:lysozyme family protein